MESSQNFHLFFSFLLFLNLLFIVYSTNKYSKYLNNNADILKEERPFRMNKLNLIWQKAVKRLSSDQLQEFYEEMDVQDNLEMDLKHKKLESEDADGELEAAIRNKFFSLLHTYGLVETVGEFDREFSKILKDDMNTRKFNPNKLDKKLALLWKDAQKSDFTEFELEEFKKELIHQQGKMNEYNLLMRELDSLEGVSDNSLEPIKAADGEILEFKKKKMLLKQMHRDMKDDFELLDKKTQLKQEPHDEFSHPKALKMWNMAKHANFSETELLSFKEELKHFQHRLEKHEFLQEDLVLSEDRYKKKGRESNDMPENHIELQKKVDDYQFKVKKYETELKTKLAKQIAKHSEL